ncbi:hypothetical protein ACTUSR_07905 [Pantoea stewartii subsp. indologenes]|uniref:hypothetical protein n=1 Tax=Pantoea stewartii TaxID=66269 RepID=UPI003FA4841E
MKFMLLLVIGIPLLAQSAVNCDLIATRNLAAISLKDSQENHESMKSLCLKGVEYADMGVDKSRLEYEINKLKSQSKNIVERRKLDVIMSGFAARIDEENTGQFDFKSQKFLTKKEVHRRDEVISFCSQQASLLVAEGVKDGSIPIDPYIQNSYLSDITNRCISENL